VSYKRVHDTNRYRAIVPENLEIARFLKDEKSRRTLARRRLDSSDADERRQDEEEQNQAKEEDDRHTEDLVLLRPFLEVVVLHDDEQTLKLKVSRQEGCKNRRNRQFPKHCLTTDRLLKPARFLVQSESVPRQPQQPQQFERLPPGRHRDHVIVNSQHLKPPRRTSALRAFMRVL
jgi:hypothetical protein